MKRSRIGRLLNASFSAKLVALSYLQRRITTELFYRFQFRGMGSRCVIYRPMIINHAECIELGDRVSIRDGVRLEAIHDPYGRVPLLKIGSNTNIEQGVHIICHNRVTIGRDVSITGRCAIVDVTHPYQDVSSGKVGELIEDRDSFVEIGDGAFLGYGAVVLPNVRIGKRAVVGANSVVTHDVPDFAVAAGSPAKVIKVYSQRLRRWVSPDALESDKGELV